MLPKDGIDTCPAGRGTPTRTACTTLVAPGSLIARAPVNVAVGVIGLYLDFSVISDTRNSGVTIIGT